MKTERQNHMDTSFDKSSGPFIERLLFDHRFLVILLCVVLTAAFAWQLRLLTVNASFDKMLPQSHSFVQNYFENSDQLRISENSIRIVIENTEGDIYDRDYLSVVAEAYDKIFLTSYADRAWIQALFSPAVRWSEVTEQGFTGGSVMPSGSMAQEDFLTNLKINIGKADLVGTLVADNERSTMIVMPLLERDSQTGEVVSYAEVSRMLEELRSTVEEDPRYRVHIIGFGKLVGDLIQALEKVMTFFLLAAAIVAIIIYTYSRSARGTFVVLFSSMVAVVWQLGLSATIGQEINPYSVLVPFLVFAIGVSHGTQSMNGILQDVGRGMSGYVAARQTFRRLLIPGLMALVSDAVGFAVLMYIDIPVIRELAWLASIGVAFLILTNLILLPILLSLTGVSTKAAKRSLGSPAGKAGVGSSIALFLERFAERRNATIVLVGAIILGGLGYIKSKEVQIGDLDQGAPELRADSPYNLDNAFITANYGTSSDVFIVMVKTASEGCRTYETLTEMSRLEKQLGAVPGVQKTESLVGLVRQYNAGAYYGNQKWLTVARDDYLLRDAVNFGQLWNSSLLNNDCSLVPVLAYLADHKADTLARVTDAAQEFADTVSTEDRQFLLAAGNAGVAAATNEVVASASSMMLIYVYAAVALVCFITFRSWRAVLIALLPLVLTSVLSEALMVALGIGIKVATLPVIALGVGVGVDYALYLLSAQIAFLRQGLPLREAYRHALASTGKVVALIGVTLAVGVITWAWSPIKFQADMGILLTFMFIWNMLGALVLIPALSYFLLPKVGALRTAGSSFDESQINFGSGQERVSTT